MHMAKRFSRTLGILSTLVLAACSSPPVTRHADVIVAGAGIAGLSAALEASANNARVILLDVNSVGGGHAVKAGGFALVDTALQRSKGINDSPELAFGDWALRGGDPNTYWAWRYAEASAADVHDWLTEQGVQFKIVLPTSEDRVPRFHFTAGTAVNAVIPLLRKALYDTNIELLWNTRAVALTRSRGRVNGVKVRDERSGKTRLLRSNAVILATGGLQNNLDEVRNNWDSDAESPTRLLAGAGHFATGDGYRLAKWAGAELRDMQKQVIFYNGVPDPRDPSGTRGLVAQNQAAIWVNAAGHRFIDEAADAATVTKTLRAIPDPGYWMIFDAEGARRFSMRDAAWLNRDTIRKDVLDNPTIVHQARSIKALARKAGLPEHGLQTTVEIWNRMVEFQEDFQFGRFNKQSSKRSLRNIKPLRSPPYYAVRTWPLTRKNMGGPAISPRGQVVSKSGQPVAGLYAAGELTGVAGINGSVGGAGTFLGPSVFTGRIAGAAAAADAGNALSYTPLKTRRDTTTPSPGAPGYWHFDKVHGLVSERGQSCESCHSTTNPMQAAKARGVLLARLDTCIQCH